MDDFCPRKTRKDAENIQRDPAVSVCNFLFSFAFLGVFRGPFPLRFLREKIDLVRVLFSSPITEKITSQNYAQTWNRRRYDHSGR